MKHLILWLSIIVLPATLSAQDLYQYRGKVFSPEDFSQYKKQRLDNFRERSNSSEVAFKETVIRVFESSGKTVYEVDLNMLVGKRLIKKMQQQEQLMNLDFPIEQLAAVANKPALKKYRGKPMLVNFWSTTCPPCLKEIPLLHQIKDSLGDEVVFIAVTRDKQEKIDKFLSKKAFNFIHVTEADAFMNELGITAYPQNFFIDRNGKIRTIEGALKYTNKSDKIADLHRGQILFGILRP
ncbi:MAG: TlpA disulfide reductase family protein [Flavobacteriaceae bacterium]|nr:TlpA disulfide reductase family protein [Flavobacteriaceae bacterium]